MGLSHINEAGEAHMVDVGDKAITSRTAIASGRVRMAEQTLLAIQNDSMAKGEVLAVARIAGIQGAKRCSDLIPLCHPLPLTKITVDFAVIDATLMEITAQCRVTGKTGVEMEALTAVSLAALTIYDMCKAVDKGMTIEGIGLIEKVGGKSGHWVRSERTSSTSGQTTSLGGKGDE